MKGWLVGIILDPALKINADVKSDVIQYYITSSLRYRHEIFLKILAPRVRPTMPAIARASRSLYAVMSLEN